MTTTLLIAFAATLAFVVPGRLAGAAWVGRAPRLAILAWQAVGYGVIIALVFAAGVSLMHWSATHDLACATWQVCLDALHGAHGRTAQVLAFAGLALLLLLTLRLATASWQMATADGRTRRRQRLMLRLTGTVRADLGATVVPAPAPAAYLIPGRHHEVVVTTGALDRLAPPELAAVLEHERAHIKGHHHWLRAGAGLLHRAFPWVPVFGHAQRQVGRLVELCADDTAVRRRGALPLARALVALTASGPEPAALHAAGGDPAERLSRLLTPPAPIPLPVRALAVVGWALVPVVPVIIVALEHFSAGS
jgi:Zn-dependent protease with chaperone function